MKSNTIQTHISIEINRLVRTEINKKDEVANGRDKKPTQTHKQNMIEMKRCKFNKC